MMGARAEGTRRTAAALALLVLPLLVLVPVLAGTTCIHSHDGHLHAHRAALPVPGGRATFPSEARPEKREPCGHAGCRHGETPTPEIANGEAPHDGGLLIVLPELELARPDAPSTSLRLPPPPALPVASAAIVARLAANDAAPRIDAPRAPPPPGGRELLRAYVSFLI
ncbi:MAG: hypothetical protein R3F20_15605 [Planctomycetota bacterium]